MDESHLSFLAGLIIIVAVFVIFFFYCEPCFRLVNNEEMIIRLVDKAILERYCSIIQGSPLVPGPVPGHSLFRTGPWTWCASMHECVHVHKAAFVKVACMCNQSLSPNNTVIAITASAVCQAKKVGDGWHGRQNRD